MSLPFCITLLFWRPFSPNCYQVTDLAFLSLFPLLFRHAGIWRSAAFCAVSVLLQNKKAPRVKSVLALLNPRARRALCRGMGRGRPLWVFRARARQDFLFPCPSASTGPKQQRQQTGTTRPRAPRSALMVKSSCQYHWLKWKHSSWPFWKRLWSVTDQATSPARVFGTPQMRNISAQVEVFSSFTLYGCFNRFWSCSFRNFVHLVYNEEQNVKISLLNDCSGEVNTSCPRGEHDAKAYISQQSCFLQC